MSQVSIDFNYYIYMKYKKRDDLKMEIFSFETEFRENIFI